MALIDQFFGIAGKAFACLPNDLYARFSKKLGRCSNGTIDGEGAEAAPGDKQNGLGPAEAEVPKGNIDIVQREAEALADGIAGEDYFICGEVAIHSGPSHADGLCTLGQPFVGEAGEAVLLLDDIGNAEHAAGQQRWPAGIAPNPDGYLRFEVANGLADTKHRAESHERHRKIFEREAALDSFDGQANNVVACGGHFIHFHTL